MPDPKKKVVKKDTVNYQARIDSGMDAYQLSDMPGVSNAKTAKMQKEIDSTAAAHKQRIMNIKKKIGG